nr:hypothetical protein [uncultured Noviherbaspirillum sp.]
MAVNLDPYLSSGLAAVAQAEAAEAWNYADNQRAAADSWRQHAERLQQSLGALDKKFVEKFGSEHAQNVLKQAALTALAEACPDHPLLNQDYRTQIYNAAREEGMANLLTWRKEEAARKENERLAAIKAAKKRKFKRQLLIATFLIVSYLILNFIFGK